MPLAQFVNTLLRISTARHVNRPKAFGKHLAWQARKVFGLFPVTLTFSRSLISDDNSTGVISEINALGLYDYNNMLLLVECTRGGGTFLDIGANIGSYTLLVSENEQAHVIAFEPNPRAFGKLVANVARNRRENVELHNIALSDHDGTLAMTDDGSAATNRIVEDGAISVPVRRLDTFLLEAAAGAIIAKIDVEGHEIQVLRGSGADLTRIALLTIESWPGRATELSAYLREHGFLGPFQADATSRLLRRATPTIAEDPVFVSDPMFLHSIGWAIED